MEDTELAENGSSFEKVEKEKDISKVVQFDAKYKKDAPPAKGFTKHVSNRIKKCFTKQECINTLNSNFPFIRMLKKYKVKEDLVNDIIAGMTVGIMQIPQGEFFFIHR